VSKRASPLAHFIKDMKNNSIITITEAAKRSLLRLCNRELQRREDNGYIDVDVEYIEREEKKSLINWGDLAAGFIASAITMAVLSYLFVIFGIVYLFINNS
jgi:hypothetical protein